MLSKRAFIRQSFLEYVEYRKGHRNSKDEAAPWVIISHTTGKVLSSHATKEDAEKHLQEMEYFKHK